MFKHLDLDGLSALYDQAVLVDIRDANSFAAGHLKGAIALTQENVEAFVENTPKDAAVVVVCYHGNSSQSAAAYLAEQGFSDVYSLDGGFELAKTRVPTEWLASQN